MNYYAQINHISISFVGRYEEGLNFNTVMTESQVTV
jgi:hypothetical protein